MIRLCINPNCVFPQKSAGTINPNNYFSQFRREVTPMPLSIIATLRRFGTRNRGTRFPVSQNDLDTDFCSWRYFDVRLPKIRGYDQVIVSGFKSRCKFFDSTYLNLTIYVVGDRILFWVYSRLGSPRLSTYNLSLHSTDSHQKQTQFQAMKSLVFSSNRFSFVSLSRSAAHNSVSLFATTSLCLFQGNYFKNLEKSTLIHLVAAPERTRYSI
jgi:hypothetical protein